MLRKALILAAFRVIRDMFINRIDFEPLRTFLDRLVTPAHAIADILTDKDPNNKPQLEAFWNENKDALLDTGVDAAIQIVKMRVKNETIRDLVVAALESIDPKTGQLKPDAL